MAEWECIDTRNGIVHMSDGVELPITQYIDTDGEQCEPCEAVVIVAGTDDYGWLAIEIDWDSLETVTVH